MGVRVVVAGGGYRLAGDDAVACLVNRFLDHLVVRNFSPSTVRAYAFDLANFAGFLSDRCPEVAAVRPADLFVYLDWQRAVGRSASASTMNRRVSTVRSWFEFLVTVEVLDENPVPKARRSSGLRAVRRGMLGHGARTPGRDSGDQVGERSSPPPREPRHR